MLHIHSFIYHQRCIMFFSQYFSFPCQYHSTNAPYSFIHLPGHCIIFFSQYFSFSCQYHSTNAPYSFIHLPGHCIIFFSQYVSFPCQYHSTNAPYSFIHLPPTLYNVSLSVLQFPLSVSFHQCSILIHSSTTDAV